MRVYKFILTALLLLYSSITLAEDADGMVVAIRGASIADDRVLSQGDFVSIGEVIVTSARSFVVIQLSDGSKITVRPDSTVEISEYVYNGGPEDMVNLSLVEGGLRIVTGAIAKSNPDNYVLETPVALMGVRGTEFSILLCDERECTP